MAKPLVINADLAPCETNPHSWLVLTGSEPNAPGPRIMTGTLRPTYRGFAVPGGASGFARVKVNVVPSPDSPWAVTAARAEVLLPAGADDRFSSPRILMEEADRLATQPTDPLLAYVTLTWMPGRLHEMYEEIRAFALEEIVSLGCPVLLVLHAPHLKLSSALPHCHLCIVPVVLGSLGWMSRVPRLTGDKGRTLVVDRYAAFRARRAAAGNAVSVG